MISKVQEQFKKIVLGESEAPLETTSHAIALHALMEMDPKRMKALRGEAFTFGFSPEEWVFWALLKGDVQLLDDWPHTPISWNSPVESSSKHASLIQEILDYDQVDFLKRALELGCTLDQSVSSEDDRRPLSYALAKFQPATTEWLIEQSSLLSNPTLVADACLTMEVASIQSYASSFNMESLRKLLAHLDESTPIVYHKNQEKALPFLKIWVDCVTNTPSGEDVLLTKKWSAHPELTIPKVFGRTPVAHEAVSALHPTSVFSNTMLCVFRKWDEKLQAQHLQEPTQSFWTLYIPLVQKAFFASENVATDLEGDLASLLKIKPSQEPPLTWSEWKGFLSDVVSHKNGLDPVLLHAFLLDEWLPHLDETAQAMWPVYQQELKDRLKNTATTRFNSTLDAICASQIRLAIESLPEQGHDLTLKSKQRL